MNDEIKTKLIGLLAILIGLWLALYFIPEVFVSLFNTLLGNIILIISTILVYTNNRIYGLSFGLLVLILYRFSRLSKEGFNVSVSGTFTVDESRKNAEEDFLRIQSTINKNKVFDMNIIKSQTTPEELDYFNSHGMWPWSPDVISLFQEALNRNPYIRTIPEIMTNHVRTIYNEAAILRVLSYQTKEGQFLLNGVLVRDPSGNKMEELPNGFGNFGYEAGLLGNRVDDVIKCNLTDDNNPTLERIRYTGKGGIYGEQTERAIPVDYHDLEKIIPGFTFINEPCNPCGSMSANPDYSCAYKLKVKNKTPFISDIWQYLWGIKDTPVDAKT